MKQNIQTINNNQLSNNLLIENNKYNLHKQANIRINIWTKKFSWPFLIDFIKKF